MTAALLDVSPVAPHFDVSAAYEARKGGGEVAVRFVAKDPDVKINEAPAPKLKLEAGPVTLAPAPAAAKAAAPAGGPGKYLDLTLPVTFPVAVAAGTAKGEHPARGTVTYFYCSKREGWCRKGTAAVAFDVPVR